MYDGCCCCVFWFAWYDCELLLDVHGYAYGLVVSVLGMDVRNCWS